MKENYEEVTNEMILVKLVWSTKKSQTLESLNMKVVILGEHVIKV